MRRTALVVLALAAITAAVAAAASSRGPAVAVPQAVKSPTKGVGPLLAVVPGVRGPVLGRADKRALWIARHGPRLRLHNNFVGWAYSPERDLLAVATEREAGTTDPIPAVQFVRPYSLARVGNTKLDDGHIAALAWGENRVNVVVERWCCPASVEVISIDAGTMKVVSRQRLSNALVQAGRAGGTLVLVVGPAVGIGTATLVVIDPSGAVRTATLSRTVAGRDMPNEEEQPDFSKLRQDIPGLAVDPDGGRAFVVPASGAVAAVSLASLAVSYHDVAQPVSLLGRLHDWLEPNAAAKGINGPIRTARWLGNGVLAVTGGDEAISGDPSQNVRMTWTPAGLKLIDTNTWGSKLIDRGADTFTVAGDTLLATGARWDSQEEMRAGMGLVAYGFDGARKVAALRGSAAYVLLAFRGRAYVAVADNAHVTKVVDLANGAMLKDRRAPLAQLLLGDGSTS
jgi:hypothetical protein